MAGILDLLINGASGGVVGSILNLGTRWFDVLAKKKEAEIEIMRMEAMARVKVEEMSWAAFGKSQEGVNEDVAVSEKADQWVVNLGELVDCFRSFTRPALTWLLMVVLLVVFLRSNGPTQAEMAGEITFGSFTALFWWFGSRYGRK